MSTNDTPKLCTIARAAEGTTEPCPEERCAYWERGCVLDGVQSELLVHPEVAGLLLGMRRRLEQARLEESRLDDRNAAVGCFHRRLAAGRE